MAQESPEPKAAPEARLETVLASQGDDSGLALAKGGEGESGTLPGASA